MARTKRTKCTPIVDIESPRNIRKISISSYSSKNYCNLAAVISAYITPPNGPKNATSDGISISEYSKQYSKHNSINTDSVAHKSSPPPPPIFIIGTPPPPHTQRN